VEVTEKKQFPVSGVCNVALGSGEKKGPGEKAAFRRIKNSGVICCARSGNQNGSAMKGKSKLTIATATAVLAVLVAAAVYAQENDKYSLKSPSGIAFSDFTGYEDWSVVSSARTDEVLKVIVANPHVQQS